jgi:putative transposase
MTKQGKTIDFLLTAKRDMASAKPFFDKAMRENGVPDKVAMDKSGANKAAIDAVNAGRDVPIVVRQVKYLENIVEQDHRAINRVTRPMINFKSFRGAGCVLAGVELMHMIRKGQFTIDGADTMSFTDQFYTLAAQLRPVCGAPVPFLENSFFGSTTRHNPQRSHVDLIRSRSGITPNMGGFGK